MEEKSKKSSVLLKGDLSRPPGNALWLVKWLLLLPHIVILLFLWIAFVFVTIIAFFAILFTGKYPRSLFDFNVGVLRWTWRASFYGYQALATDQYPPFSLKTADYPADLEVEYPEKLTQWLILFKWFLAIPHFAILAFLVGGGTPSESFPQGGLLAVLLIITAFVLLFTGRYLKDIFTLVLGINRWAYRVIAYITLMTDEYPHFRLWE